MRASDASTGPHPLPGAAGGNLRPDGPTRPPPRSVQDGLDPPSGVPGPQPGPARGRRDHRPGLLRVAPTTAELALAFSRTPGKLARAQAIKGEADRRRLRERACSQAPRQRARQLDLAHDQRAPLLADPRGRRARGALHLPGQFFDEVHAVAYLRRPDHLAPSLFAGGVKAGRTKPLNAGFVEQRNVPSTTPVSWRSGRQSWAPGRRGQAVRRVVQGRPTDLVSRPARASSRSAAGCPSWTRARRWTWPDRPLNQSLSAEGTEFLRLVNPHVPEGALTQSQRRALIAEVRTRCPGAAVTLTTGARRALSELGFSPAGLDREEWAARIAGGRSGSTPPLRRSRRCRCHRRVDWSP